MLVLSVKYIYTHTPPIQYHVQALLSLSHFSHIKIYLPHKEVTTVFTASVLEKRHSYQLYPLCKSVEPSLERKANIFVLRIFDNIYWKHYMTQPDPIRKSFSKYVNGI